MCACSQSAVSQRNKRLFQGNNVLSVGRIKLNELNAVVFTAEQKHDTDRQQLSPLDIFFWSCNPIEPSVLMLSNYRVNHLLRAERVGSNLAANFTNLMYGLVNPNKDEENG